MNNKNIRERDELHKAIWSIADDLRGSVDGWDFKQYILGIMFYRYISENITNYINEGERKAGDKDFDYTKISDEMAEGERDNLVKEKGFFILPSELFCNVCKIANNEKERLNEILEKIFRNIENSAKGHESEDDFSGLFDDIDVNSNKLGATVPKRNEKLIKILKGIESIPLGNYKENSIDAFGDKNANGIVLLKSYGDYYYGYEDEKGGKQLGYEERITNLLQKYPLGEQIVGEQAKRDFIAEMGNILRLRNILTSFDKFEGNEILNDRDFQEYIGTYTDLYEEFKPKKGKSESIKDDIVFEMELVKQVEVNIDYILMLVAKYHESNCTDKEILGSIDKAIKSSLLLRSKKDLIDSFISKINANTNVQDDWTKFVKEQKEIDLKKLINEENLNEDETRKFINNSFRDGAVKTIGTDIEKILPPMRRFGGGNRTERKQTIIEKMLKFFEKYFGIIENGGDKEQKRHD